MSKWELCYVRPPVLQGAEVIFFHPDSERNQQYRNLRDFAKMKDINVEHSVHLLGYIISHLLSEGWEPLNTGGGIGNFAPNPPDFGATGYAFRRQV